MKFEDTVNPRVQVVSSSPGGLFIFDIFERELIRGGGLIRGGLIRGGPYKIIKIPRLFCRNFFMSI